MKLQLKPISEQVVVITGASSGIGLATAELAAQRGARLVLTSRSDETLHQVVQRLQSRGCDVIYIPCDVTQRQQVEAVAEAALAHFGRIDSWVNNAGVSIYGRLEEVSEEDSRRLFETNFWGVYYGSLTALRHLRRGGGALINIGSEVSDAVVPLQGIYSASKHAVKGFTDALRVEVQEIDHAPVSITLIQPTAVDTPFPQHARNYMQQEPKLPSPMIEPERVAEAIVDACETPTRTRRVGSTARFNVAMSRMFPALAERMAASYATRQQYDEPPRHPEGTLFNPSEQTGVAGQTHGPGGVQPH
jgi:short-subunit dehydrogenase